MTIEQQNEYGVNLSENGVWVNDWVGTVSERVSWYGGGVGV